MKQIYAYDRTQSELLVLEPIEFPSGKGTKKLPPGTALEPSGYETKNGEPFWNIAGWHAPQPADLSSQLDKCLNLRDFFEKVARAGRGSFEPPGSAKEFVLLFPSATVSVFVSSPRELVAEVEYNYGSKEDNLIELSVSDFKDPKSFLRTLDV